MSQDQISDQDQQAAQEELFGATLTTGNVYVCFGRHFLRDVTQNVNAEERAVLEDTAYDTVTITRGNDQTNEEQQKFTFGPPVTEVVVAPTKRETAPVGAPRRAARSR